MFKTIAGRQVFVATLHEAFKRSSEADIVRWWLDDYTAKQRARNEEAKRIAARKRTRVELFPALRAQDRIENYSVLDLRSDPKQRNSVFGNPADMTRPLVVLTDQTTFHFNAGRTEGRAEPVAA